MHDEKGEYNGENGSRTRRDFYARRYPNSRSYGIGSHKLKSTRALAREGTRRALSFRLLLFLCPPLLAQMRRTPWSRAAATASDIFSRLSSYRLLLAWWFFFFRTFFLSSQILLSLFSSSLYDSTTQSHVIRSEYVSLRETWILERGSLTAKCGRPRSVWRDFAIRTIIMRNLVPLHGTRPISSTKLFFFNGKCHDTEYCE